MASRELRNIFLSASIPLPERDKKYIETCDIIAIRDAVIALVNIVIPKYRLIWGGHPSITPLVNYVVQKQKGKEMVQNNVLLYQSLFFKKYFPKDNNKFKNIRYTRALENRESSLKLMRDNMVGQNDYDAGIFIGGMKGVEDEYNLFREYHPNAKIIPLGSTGAAAKIIMEKENYNDDRLMNNYAYSSLFKEFLIDNNLNYG